MSYWLNFTSLSPHHPASLSKYYLPPGVWEPSLGDPVLTFLPTSLQNCFWMTVSSKRAQVCIASRTLLSQVVRRSRGNGQTHSCDCGSWGVVGGMRPRGSSRSTSSPHQL